MPNRSRKPKPSGDLNQRAKAVVDYLTRDRAAEPAPEAAEPPDPIRQAAAELGRRGGLKGGPARAKKLTKKQRSESAKKAAAARWAKRKKTIEMRRDAARAQMRFHRLEYATWKKVAEEMDALLASIPASPRPATIPARRAQRAAENGEPETKKEIALRILDAASAPMHLNEIAASVRAERGMPAFDGLARDDQVYGTVESALRRFEKDGLCRRVGKGMWEMVHKKARQ